ncbi:MAG: transglycosylase SLT domain-containing protein [Candidatus Methylumidiphilus sp.]
MVNDFWRRRKSGGLLARRGRDCRAGKPPAFLSAAASVNIAARTANRVRAVAKQGLRKKSSKNAPQAKPKRVSKAVFGKLALPHGRRALWLGVEICALAAVALVAVIAALGLAAEHFAGEDLWASLVPFAGAVLVLAVLVFAGFKLWQFVRRPLAGQSAILPALLALAVAGGVGWHALGGEFREELGRLRGLVGGVRHAERETLSHQVYAAYRRADLAQMQLLVRRAQPYQAAIQEAAAAFGVDGQVLLGIGAAESSYLPRDSKDGGRGLFQITAPPKPVLAAVRKRLNGAVLDWRETRHNALLAAATWRHYQKEMKGDIFLSLLAYNIGPKNGGLLSIMRQYGARDFATIQPYLQHLPRDYPIRVLTAALAFRLWQTEGNLPHYEEGDNARRIQAIGIPGLGMPGL